MCDNVYRKFEGDEGFDVAEVQRDATERNLVVASAARWNVVLLVRNG